MSTYDWSGVADSAPSQQLPAGTYRVEVIAAESKMSNNKNPMWVLTLKALDFNTKLCQDNLMLPPNAGASISKAKLAVLGIRPEDLNKTEPGHLFGKRTWVTVKSEPYKDKDNNDRTALRVDIYAKGSKCGYWEEKPGQVNEPVAKAADDSPPW